MYICICIYVYVYMYICIYVYMYICIYVYVYVYIIYTCNYVYMSILAGAKPHCVGAKDKAVRICCKAIGVTSMVTTLTVSQAQLAFLPPPITSTV